MKRAYFIPLTPGNAPETPNSRVQDHFARVTSRPNIQWDDPSNKCIVADGTGYVELCGSIPGETEVPVRVQGGG